MPKLLNLDKCEVGQVGSFFVNSSWTLTRPVYTPIEADEICEASKDHISVSDVKKINCTFMFEIARLGIGIKATEREEDRLRREAEEREQMKVLEHQRALLERAKRDREKWEQEKEKWEAQRREHMKALGGGPSSGSPFMTDKRRKLDMPDFDEL